MFSFCVCVQASTKLLDEMCHLTAQSLTAMDTSEHFKVLKLLGEGSYGKVMLAVHKTQGEGGGELTLCAPKHQNRPTWVLMVPSMFPGTPMALKFFPRESTSLFSFLREYNLSLSFCTHPSLTRALGIAYFTSSHYIFAQQASLFGDLYDIIMPEVYSYFKVIDATAHTVCIMFQSDPSDSGIRH